MKLKRLGVLAVCSLLLVSGLLQIVASVRGRALLQEWFLLSSSRSICLDGLSVSIDAQWIVESLPGRAGWTAYLVGLIPAQHVAQPNPIKWALQIAHRGSSSRVVISRPAEELDWPRVLNGCNESSSCKVMASPFFGDKRISLLVEKDGQLWYQHEQLGLLVSAHDTGQSSNLKGIKLQLGDCPQ